MDGELMRFTMLALSLLLAAHAHAQQFVDTLTSSTVVGGGGGGGITINDLVNCSTPADCYEDTTSTTQATQSVSWGANTHVYVIFSVSVSGGDGSCRDTDSPSVSGGPGSWTLIKHACNDGAQRRIVNIYRGTSGSSGSGAITLGYSPATTGVEGYAWSILEAVGLNSGTPNDTGGEGFQGSGTSNSTADLGDPDAGDYVIAGCNVEDSGVSAVINGELSNQLENFDGMVGIRTFVTGYDSSPDSTPTPGVTWTGTSSSTCAGVILND